MGQRTDQTKESNPRHTARPRAAPVARIFHCRHVARFPLNNVEARVSAYYFTSFAVIGVAIPYFALWLDGLGATPAWTGVVVAAPSLLSIAAAPLLGVWADRLGDWRYAIILCNQGALLALCGWLFSTDPLMLLLVWAITGTLAMATSPITDAASLSLAKQGQLMYGRVRGMGSLGYILAVIFCGAMFDAFGSVVFLYVLFPIVALRALAAHRLPRVEQTEVLPTPTQTVTAIRDFSLPAPGYLVVLCAAALINASHATFYTFGLLHWESIGIDPRLGSWLFIIGVVFEIILMWRFSGLAQRFSARHCLFLAAACSVLRWIVMAQDPSLPTIAAVQSLHAISFGLTYLAIVNFIANRTPDRRAAGAQTMNASLNTAALALATLLSGQLFERFGGQTYLAMTALCVVAMALIGLSYRLRMDADPKFPSATITP